MQGASYGKQWVCQRCGVRIAVSGVWCQDCGVWGVVSGIHVLNMECYIHCTSTTVLEGPCIILEHYPHSNDTNLNIHGVLMMNDNDIKGQ